MKKALVTGGAGFIGFHLSRYLASLDYEVTIMDNFARSRQDPELSKLLERPNVGLLECDLTKPNALKNIAKFEEVYHLAAINGTKNFYEKPDEVLRVGILGTLNVLEWMSKKGGKLLFTSSSETYAGAMNLLPEFPIPTPEQVPLVIEDPSNVRWSYAVGKIAGEVAVHSYAKARGLEDFAILRYHNIYGERMGHDHVIPEFIKRALSKENPFKIYGGEETRSFCYIDDAVAATHLLLQNPKASRQTIHVGRDDAELPIKDLAKQIYEIAGYSPKLVFLPAPKGSVKRRCPDTTKLNSLGFRPKISLEQGLKKTFEWYKNV